MKEEVLLKEKIISIEQRYPVEKWKVNGVDVWPLIRIKIYLTVLAGHSLVGEPHTTSFMWFRKTYVYKLIRFVYAFFSYLKFMSGLTKKSLFFFSSGLLRLNFKDKAFNKIFDSMIDYHDLKNDVFVFEYERRHKNIFNSKAVYFLDDFIKEFKVVKRLFVKKKKGTICLDNYDLFLKEINEDPLYITVNGFFTKEKVEVWVKKLNSNSVFFEKVFKKIQPEKIIYSNFYSLDDVMASLIAANRLGIKTIDMQHGPISNIHLVFSCWEKFPDEGYNTMVQEFWTWEEISNKSISQWSNKVASVDSKIIGNTFLSYLIEKENLNSDDFSKENQIIYTFQPIYTVERMVHSSLVQVIEDLDVKWVFRLHPRNTFKKEEVVRYLEKQNIYHKVRVEEYFDSPLPVALRKSMLHVTNYSGSLIEAKLMGIPTFLIDSFAEGLYYDDYGNDDDVFFLDVEKEEFANKFKTIFLDYHFEKKRIKKMQVYNPINN